MLRGMRGLPTRPPAGAETVIRQRIAERGPITFAEFMSVALYGRDGYYASRMALGPQGDFTTAPLTHPVFGALVARQIEQMWRELGAPPAMTVVEAGAGSGQLAADVVAASDSLDGAFARALRYVALDYASAPARQRVHWLRSGGLPVAGLRGVILGNELIDAMPVHRMTMADGVLREIRVSVDNAGKFEETLAEPEEGLAQRLTFLGVRLSDGHRAEICLDSTRWVAEAAGAIDAGYLLLVDYGHEAVAYYDESRRRGTLRCYYQHTLGMDPYVHVGRQDISVHVELTSLRTAARDAGLTEAGSATQADFLRSLGFDAYRAAIERRRDLPAAVRVGNLRALDMLVDAEGMGGFRVLAFAKGVPATPLAGFTGGSPALDVRALLATPSHMPAGAAEDAVMPTWEDLLR